MKKVIPVILVFFVICIIIFAQEAMLINAMGDVGIGLAEGEEPTAKLEVAGNIKAAVPIKTSEDETYTVMRDILEALCPVGTIQAFSGTVAPDGWLLCDGDDISRETYKELYDVIGNNFGYGDGSTTFHLPNLHGQFLRGVSENESQDPDRSKRKNISGVVGPNIGSYQDDAFQGHKHTGYSIEGYGNGNTRGYDSTNEGVHSRPIQDWQTGIGELGAYGLPKISSETRPKNVYVNFIIKY